MVAVDVNERVRTAPPEFRNMRLPVAGEGIQFIGDVFFDVRVMFEGGQNLGTGA
ncbi:MAG: hypothetical protein HZC41_21820 [Chloroflexi bacterium]|nr:hypothetical protein [Chloroflexota bacterium]